MTEHLPFLVEHGPVVWRVAQVALVVAVLASVWVIRRAIARSEVRAGLRRVRANHGAIRGTLRGAATTVTARPSQRSTPSEHLLSEQKASWRADGLWLETPDRRIELVGPVSVVAGTRYDARRGRLPALPAECREVVTSKIAWSKGPIAGGVAVHVVEGDEVEVRGTPESRAGRQETTSREADIEWTMQADADSALPIAAVAPVIPRLPLGVIRSLVVAGLTFGVSHVVLSGLGEGWVDTCDSTTADADTPIELSNTHVCVLGASVSKHRERGLAELHAHVEEHPYRDEATMQRIDALARYTDECRVRVDRIRRQGRVEAWLDEARLCGDRRGEHEALVSLGRFEEAVAIVVPATEHEPPLPEATTWIAAGRWREAAAAVRDHTKRSKLHADADSGAWREWRGCIADWLDHLGGDAAAAARVRASDPKNCGAILAELDPKFPPANDAPWRDVPELLLIRSQIYIDDPRTLWLPVVGDSPIDRIRRLRRKAVKQVVDNDPDAALATAREVIELARQVRERGEVDEYSFTLNGPDFLIEAIQMHTPTIFEGITKRADEAIAHRVEHATRILGKPPDRGQEHDLYMHPYEILYARAKEPIDPARTKYVDQISIAAREGRVGKVLQIVREKYGPTWDPIDLLAVLPHLPSLRPVLARELPYRLGERWSMRSPGVRAMEAVVRRELFEAVGAPEVAAKWDAIYRRHDAMLRDRAKVIAIGFVD